MGSENLAWNLYQKKYGCEVKERDNSMLMGKKQQRRKFENEKTNWGMGKREEGRERD